MLLNLLLPFAEQALNKLLALDAEIFTQLAPLIGKVVCVQLLTSNNCIYLQVQAHRIQLTSTCTQAPDVILTGTPFDFLRLMQAETSSAALLESAIKITGDIAVAQHFKQAFAQLDIDLEEQLAQLTGDVIAHQVGRALRSLMQWARHSRIDLSEDTTDYLQVEQQLLPPQHAVQTFLQGVDTTRDAVERLSLRVQRLQAR